jgi:hypothetical protein
MSTFIRTAIIAVAVLSSISAASARSYRPLEENGVIASDRDLNNPESVKEFWDNQQHSGS